MAGTPNQDYLVAPTGQRRPVLDRLAHEHPDLPLAFDRPSSVRAAG